jgi:predicted helicase
VRDAGGSNIHGGVGGMSHPSAVTPRPHQSEAIAAAERAFAGGAERVQWRMACGTGKTLASMWLAERIKARTVVVFAPTIALVAQILQVWQQSGAAVRALAATLPADQALKLEQSLRASAADLADQGLSADADAALAAEVAQLLDAIAAARTSGQPSPPGTLS